MYNEIFIVSCVQKEWLLFYQVFILSLVIGEVFLYVVLVMECIVYFNYCVVFFVFVFKIIYLWYKIKEFIVII